MEKKGQSDVIATVLIILLVLTAIIIVWNVVNSVLKKSTEQIGTDALTTHLEIENAEFYVTGGAKVKLSRGGGEGNITSLKFIFYDEDGESEIIEKKENIIGELETKVYEFTSDEINFRVSKVSVVPIFGKNSGIIVKEEAPKTDFPSEGLVAWWKFDGDAKDSVGRNGGTAYDANISNADGDTPPKIIDNAVVFDGIDDYAGSNFLEAGAVVNTFTYSFWYYPKSAHEIDTESTAPAYFGGGLSGERYALFPGSGDTYPPSTCSPSPGMYHVGVGVSAATNGVSVYEHSCNYVPALLVYDDAGNNRINGWTYVTIIMNNQAPSLYINGEFIKTGLKGPSQYSHALLSTIGGSTYGWFNGSIDNVMIFNRALSESEINAMYNIQKK